MEFLLEYEKKSTKALTFAFSHAKRNTCEIKDFCGLRN